MSETPLMRAYRLIDAQRDNEAIDYLSSLTAADPANADYQVALASAYAHKAGVRVQKFVYLLAKRDTLVSPADWAQLVQSHSKEMDFKIDDFTGRFAGILKAYSKLFVIYAKIPSVNRNGEPFLQEAIKILAALPKLRPSDAVYLAILRGIEFKYVFAEDLIAPIARDQEDANNCQIDLVQAQQVLVRLGRALINILADLCISNPSDASSFRAEQKDVADETFSLTLALSSLDVTDEATQLIFKQLVIQEGFGKLLRCKIGSTSGI